MLGSVLHILLLLFHGSSLAVLENGVASETYQHFHSLDLVRGFSVEDAGHTAYAAVSARNLLKLERGHIDRKFLELTLVGEELVRLFEPCQILPCLFQQGTVAVRVS